MTTANGISKGVQAADSKAIDLLATSPSDMASVPALLEEVALYGEALPKDCRARLQLLKAARALIRALETPREGMICNLLGRLELLRPRNLSPSTSLLKYTVREQATLYAAIDTAISIGIFPLMAEQNASPKTVGWLAAIAKVDPELLSRIMKQIAAMGIIKETGPDEYRPTNLSLALFSPNSQSLLYDSSRSVNHSLNLLPEYLARTCFQNPTNGTDGPFHHQPVLSQFNNHMSAYRQGQPSWMDPDFYPVQELLVKAPLLRRTLSC
ncbi:hypothetical protein VTN77DRAFT_6255 [Rasamsonia byssochlamydoides]|uniref:uncharacterized protein n=1 Tax=Rasamsonia byssochlamydoides TaxID=89139 RepID=UPI003742D114